MIGTTAFVLGVDVTTTCDGIVIGPSFVVGRRPEGALEVGRRVVAGAMVAIGAVAVITGAVEMFDASCAYGSIGRMSPEGPAYGPPPMNGLAYGSIGVIGPDGPVANARGGAGATFGAGLIVESELELDVRGAASGAVVGCFARSGGTSQRPAA